MRKPSRLRHTWHRRGQQPAVVRPTFLVAAVATVLLVTSCPNPIPMNPAIQVSDQTGPVIALESSADDGSYGATMTFSGMVVDAGRFGGIPAQRYSRTISLTST